MGKYDEERSSMRNGWVDVGRALRDIFFAFLGIRDPRPTADKPVPEPSSYITSDPRVDKLETDVKDINTKLEDIEEKVTKFLSLKNWRNWLPILLVVLVTISILASIFSPSIRGYLN